MKRRKQSNLAYTLLYKGVEEFNKLVEKTVERGKFLQFFLVLCVAVVLSIIFIKYCIIIIILALLVFNAYLETTPYIIQDTPQINHRWLDKEWWWSLTGWEFEEEVVDILKLSIYSGDVTVTRTRGSGDGGIDIIADDLRDGKDIRTIIQCKHYRHTLGPEAVRSLWGVKEDFNADKCLMIASSGVGVAGTAFIREHGLDYDYYTLDDIIALAYNIINNRDKYSREDLTD